MTWMVLLGVVALAGGIVWLMSVLWRRYYSVDMSAALGEGEQQELVEVLRALGFGELRVRPLFRSRALWAQIERPQLTLEIELCDGAWRDYTRLHCSFTRPLNQGFQLLCEEGAGAMGWVLSFHEVELEDEELDERFILLARDDERLGELIRSPLRQEMIRLRDLVEDFQLTDQGLFLFVSYVAREQALRELIKAALYLSDDLIRWAQERGPIGPLQTGQYQGALAELDIYATRMTESAGSPNTTSEPVGPDPPEGARSAEPTLSPDEPGEDEVPVDLAQVTEQEEE